MIDTTKFIQAIEESPEIKRLHFLETSIDQNTTLKSLFVKYRLTQKEIVKAKYEKDYDKVRLYETQYKDLYDQIINLDYMQEYLDLLNECNNLVQNITFMIEKDINKDLI